MTRVKRMVCAAVLLAVWSAAARGEAVKDLAQPTSYVDDLAGVIDPGAKAQMEALGAEVEREAHATIEIVTVHSLDGQPVEEFATALEDKWKVGPKGTDRGIIMLFAVKDHKRRIEVGYGLEGVLPDAKVGDIGRSMVPDLQAGDYGSAILGGERQIADAIAKDAGVTLTPLAASAQGQRRAAQRGGGGGFVPLILLVLFLLFFFRGGRGGGGGGGGWLPWFLLGNVLGSGRRYDDGGGFSGGDGGFGGDGGGGGGDDGGFSGGFGGSSGGGGASGDW